MRGLWMLVGVMIVAACSDSSAPDPAPIVARIEMKEHTLFVFSGRRVPVYEAFTAFDAEGHVIAKPIVAVELPAGWTRVADTLVAPAGESRGTLRINAGVVTAALRMASGLGDPLDPLVDTATVNSVYDLRGRRWSATFMCRSAGLLPNGGVEFASDSDRVELDSAKYVALVDTVLYPEDSTGFMRERIFGELDAGGYAQLKWNGYVIRWRHAGGRDSLTRNGTVILWDQHPDSMWFRASRPNSAVNNPAVRANPGQLPRRYVGATWCNIDVWSGHSTHDPMLLEEVLK